MKKILFMLLFVPVLMVDAKTYYTDYYLIEENSKEKIKETDILKREEYKVYNTYETKINELGYEEHNCEKYDKNNFIIENRITANYLNNTSKLYQSFNYYDYYFQGIMFRSIKKDITVKEIKITNSNGDVPYILVDSRMPNKEFINDNKLDTEVIISTLDTFTIHLKESQITNDLKIEIISDQPLEADIIFVLKDSKFNYIQSYINTNNITFVNDEEYTNIIDIVGYFDNKEIGKSYYKSTIKKYMCYEEIINPLNIYVLSGDNINKDDYEIRYNYYKRDYIDISDKTLTKKSNLKSLIKSTSLDLSNLTIESNIDYDKSGKYQVEYIFSDITFKHNINYKKKKVTTTTTKAIKKEECNCKDKIIIKNNKINYLLIVIIICLVIIMFKKKIRGFVESI